jgi:iron complex outermembrane receptor protein
MHTSKKLTSAAISAALIGSFLSPSASIAQEAKHKTLEEVIVTARKTEENIQDVPVAITSLSGDELVKNSIVNVREVGQQTPSLLITAGAGNPTTPRLSIRGQVQNDTIFTVDPSVGIYLDDVYLGRAPGALLDMYDIQRVEVLKGPQGTLYGRNTTGGAIKIISNRADSTAGLTGFLKAGFGNYNAKTVQGAANVPLIEDKLAVRVAGLVNKRDGYSEATIVNPATGQTVNQVDTDNKDTRSVRLDAILNATDKFDLELNGDYSEIHTNGSLSSNLNGDVAAAPFSTVGASVGSIATYRNWTQSSSTIYKAITNVDPVAEVRSWGSSLAGTYSFSGDLALKAIYAHREMSGHYTYDVDGTNMPVVGTDQAPNAKQDSVELQLTGTSFDDLDWVTGLYWFKETGGEFSKQFATGTVANPVGNYLPQFGDGENKSKSAYGQATYHLTDSLSLTGGLRWTGDTKSWRGSNYTVPGPAFSTYICNFTLPYPGVDQTACVSDLSHNYKHISWTASVDWQVLDDVLLYLKNSNGYRAGGQNMRGKLPVELVPFNSETVTDWELGVKSTFFENRVRLNADVYRSAYKDIQNSVFVQTVGATGAPATATVVTNLTNGTVEGAEVEIAAQLTDSFELNVVGSYLDVQYDLSTLEASFAPTWKYAVGGTYTQPLSAGELAVNLNYSWKDSYLANTSKSVNQTPGATTEAIGLINGRISLELANIDTTVGLWGTNLANKKWTANNLLFSVTPAYTFVNASPQEPRMFGMDINKRF